MEDMSTQGNKEAIAAGGQVRDIESASSKEIKMGSSEPGPEATEISRPKILASLLDTLSGAGVEIRGAEPVPVEKRTDTQYANVFFIFATSMTSLLPVGIGSATTLGFGMSLKVAALMIVFLQFLFAIPAAYIMTIAPQTGMRQMIQSRYCFGKYGNILTSIIVTLTVGGFGVLASVNGAQCLASVQPGTLSIEGGISIIMIIALVIGFMGYRVMHMFTRWAWIPNLLALFILVGAAGDQLWQQAPPRAHTGKDYIQMVAFTAGNMITWGNVAGDYACYMPPTAPRLRIFLYCLTGIALPFSMLMILGAAIGASVFAIPAWTTAYQTHGTGAVIGFILTDRLGDFGRFILVLLGVSVLATCARDVYTISFNVPAFFPVMRKVPRVFLAAIATAAIIGVAIPASKSFIPAISAFLSIIGYYAGSSVTCFLIEYLWFRKGDPASFDPAIWDDGRKLPTGLSALGAVFISWAFIVPSMVTDWYVGPIAKKTGDLGFEFAVVISLISYLCIRTFEIRMRNRL